MSWVYMGLVIGISTAIWPLARWALSGDGNVRVMGFWASLAAAVVSLIAILARGAPLVVPSLWAAAALMAIAYAVGFIILIMRCLQTGPAGPTVTINNSAMIFGVLYGVLWLDPHVPNIWILGGAVGVFIALVMVGFGKNRDTAQGRSVGAAWLTMLLAGGLLSGLSFMTQTYVGMRHPGINNSLLYVCIGFGLSALILFLFVARDPCVLLRRKRELVGGVGLGMANAAGLPITIMVFKQLGAEIVLPVSVTSPMILVLILGVVAYKEQLSRLTWAGCLMAALSVGLLGYGSTRNSHPSLEGTPLVLMNP